MGDEAVASLSKLVEDLTTKVANLTDSNADLQEKITSAETRNVELEQHLSTSNTNIDMLRRQIQAPLLAFDPLNARVFQETHCGCPPNKLEVCFHRPPNKIPSLPRISGTLTAETPPPIAKAIIKDWYDKAVFQQILTSRESFYFTLISKFPQERLQVATSYLKLNPPGCFTWSIEQEHEYFRKFLKFVLENCFGSFGYDEALQLYDVLKQSSGQPPAAYIARWEELFLRIFAGDFTAPRDIYRALGNKQESDVKTKAFGGLHKLAKGMENSAASVVFLQTVTNFTQMTDFDRDAVISAMNNAVRLQRLEIRESGKTSRAGAKGLQMTPGDNFAELWTLSNVEVAPREEPVAEISAVRSGDRDIIKVPGYTVYIVRNPREGQPPVYFKADKEGAQSWFCQICGWGEHHYSQCSNTMDRKGDMFVPADRIQRKKNSDAKFAARKKNKEAKKNQESGN